MWNGCFVFVNLNLNFSLIREKVTSSLKGSNKFCLGGLTFSCFIYHQSMSHFHSSFVCIYFYVISMKPLPDKSNVVQRVDDMVSCGNVVK